MNIEIINLLIHHQKAAKLKIIIARFIYQINLFSSDIK